MGYAIDTASVTTGRHILKGWRWFNLTNLVVTVPPSAFAEIGWRGFLFQNLLVKISQIESSWRSAKPCY